MDDEPERGARWDFEHISFDAEPDNRTLRNITLDGDVILDALVFVETGPVHTEAHGRVLMVQGDGWHARIHDNPTALITAQNATLRFHLPDDADVQREERGWRIGLDDRTAFLAGDGRGDDTIQVSGDVRFLVHSEVDERDERERAGDDERIVKRDVRKEVRVKVQEAIDRRVVAADVRVHRETEVFRYDEVEVEVVRPERATPDDPLRVRVDADLDSGRTIVLDVDPAMLEGELELRYYDLFDDGSRTEVVFVQASSLADVLDPDDDGGQPEYWVVEDADGVQVLVSVPHWSVHEITLASLGFIVQPSVLIGIVAGVGGVAVAALALMRPRRVD